MHIILRYPDGSRMHALLLSEDGDRLRVTMPDAKDTVELRFVGEKWVDEAGNRVSIEALMWPSPPGFRREAGASREPRGSSGPGRSPYMASG